MSQRITLAMSLLTAIVCLVALGVVWRIAEDSRAANLTLVEQSRTANQAIIGKLEELSTAEEPTLEGSDWTPVQFRVTSSEGEPVENCEIRINATFLSTPASPMAGFNITEFTDARGMLDVGLLRVGSYSVFILSPWHEYNMSSVFVRPGMKLQEIVCPQRLPSTQVSFAIEWPEDLRSENLYVLGSVGREARNFAGRSWQHAGAYVAISVEGLIYPVQQFADPGGGFPVDKVVVDGTARSESIGFPPGPCSLQNVQVVSMQDLPQSTKRTVLFERLANASDEWPAFDFDLVADGENQCEVKLPEEAIGRIRLRLARQAEN